MFPDGRRRVERGENSTGDYLLMHLHERSEHCRKGAWFAAFICGFGYRVDLALHRTPRVISLPGPKTRAAIGFSGFHFGVWVTVYK